MDRYEIQILDSFDNKTYFDGQCGAIYKQTPPMVNACRKPGEWQTYDILWEAPHFKADGTIERPAYVTVLQNGVVVQNHTEVLGTTGVRLSRRNTKSTPDRAPIQLQFHGNPVRFRNIWVREMKPLVRQEAGLTPLACLQVDSRSYSARIHRATLFAGLALEVRQDLVRPRRAGLLLGPQLAAGRLGVEQFADM